MVNPHLVAEFRAEGHIKRMSPFQRAKSGLLSGGGYSADVADSSTREFAKTSPDKSEEYQAPEGPLEDLGRYASGDELFGAPVSHDPQDSHARSSEGFSGDRGSCESTINCSGCVLTFLV